MKNNYDYNKTSSVVVANISDSVLANLHRDKGGLSASIFFNRHIFEDFHSSTFFSTHLLLQKSFVC